MVKTGTRRLQKQMLMHKWLHFLKPFKEFHHRTWYIQKQYIIVASVMTGVFLPVRLIYWNYFSHHIGTNLGLMSAIAVIMYVLVHYNKLGVFGIYFQNRIRRIVFRKLFYLAILGIIYSMFIYGMLLWEIHKGEFTYMDERDLLFAHSLYAISTGNGTMAFPIIDFSNTEINYTAPSPKELTDLLNPDKIELINYELDSYYKYLKTQKMIPTEKAMMLMGMLNSTERFDWYGKLLGVESDMNFDAIKMMDMILSITLYQLNNQTGAWGSHFSSVILINDIEALILLFFYRKVYLQKDGKPWHELGMYNKHIRKFWIKNLYSNQTKRFKHWLYGFYPNWHLAYLHFANGVHLPKAFNTNHTSLNWMHNVLAGIIRHLLTD